MRIAILGGGISGLSAAYYLLERHPAARITLFEKSGRVGGWIGTERVGGVVFEQGPRTFPVSRAGRLLELIDKLKLRDHLLYSAPAASRRYLSIGRTLRPLSSFWPLLLRAGIQALWTGLQPPPAGEETLYEWGARRLGRRATEQLLDPFILGVFGGDIRALSKEACFPSSPQKRWSGGGRLFTLEGGLSSLIDRLARLPIDIRLHTPVETLVSTPKALFCNGEGPFDGAVLALPAPEAARLLGLASPVLHSASLVVIAAGWERPVVRHRGFGYLVPSRERRQLLGVVFDGQIFPAQGERITLMARPEADPRHILEEALSELGIAAPPAHLSWRPAAEAIPQLEVGHASRLAAFEAAARRLHPRLVLAGNYWQGPAVHHCLSRSREATNKIFHLIDN
jgi:oxygen-dependent protoporphyrinogen oxidase